MINYKYIIHSLSKKTINQTPSVVYKVVWEKTGTDSNGYTGSFKTATFFNIEDIPYKVPVRKKEYDENFIKFEDLLEENIISWIEQNIDMNSIHEQIEENIQNHKDDDIEIFGQDLPWIVSTK